MKHFRFLVLMFGIFNVQAQTEVYKAGSPKDINRVEFELNEAGAPVYRVFHKDILIIDSSTLGFNLKNAPALDGDFEVLNTEKSSEDDTWKMVWGEQLEVRNHYNELKILLQERSELQRKMNIIFRVYDDGIGFRYEFPEQENMDEVLITDENTQFQLTEDP
ncbi:MAG: glycoside hydrolase family 97 N-terminal domain-containing protein, partial [Salegentibacter sp.]